MKMVRYVIAVGTIFLSLALFATGEKALSCYTCYSCPPESGDSYNRSVTFFEVKACAAEIKSCYKYFHSDGRIQRGCSPTTDEEKRCPEDQGGKFRLSYCYSCFHDRCNSGNRVTEVSFLTFVTAAISAFLGAALWKYKY